MRTLNVCNVTLLPFPYPVPATLSGVDDQPLRRILDGDDPAVLVAVALAAVDRPLERAAAPAADARTRRAVAVALAYLGSDHDRALLLARDHLADHPADLLVAHVAALAKGLAP